MNPSLGWSAGDVAAACVVLFHVIKTFDNAKETPEHYRDSHAFLCELYLVVNYVSDEARMATLPDNARMQIQIISNAYLDFHTYVVKYTRISNPEKSRLEAVLPAIQWAIDELNHKVQSMKSKSLNAVAIMETLIVVDLNSKVNDLLSLDDRDEQSINTATLVLYDVREQFISLSRISEEYQSLLNDFSHNQSSQSAEMLYIKARLESTSNAQNELQEYLNILMEHLEERAQRDQAQKQQWRALLGTQSQPSIYDRDFEQSQGNIRNTNDFRDDMGELTSSHQIQQDAKKANGVNCTFEPLVPLPNRFGTKGLGSSKSRDVQATSNLLTPSVPVRRPTYGQPKKTFKPAPPVTTPPPPRRLSIPIAPLQCSSRTNMTQHSQRRSLSAKSTPFAHQSLDHQNVTGQSPRINVPYEDLPTLSHGEALPSPPALPPRRTSAPVPLTVNDFVTSETPPPLPARRDAREDALALVLIEKPPALPARTYNQSQSITLAAIEPLPPILPPRTYRNLTPLPIKPSTNGGPLPKKPQHLASISIPSRQGLIAPKPSIERVISNSSTNSSSSTNTLDSIGTATSSTSTATSVSPESSESLGFAELRKKFEARNNTATPEFGKQFQKVM